MGKVDDAAKLWDECIGDGVAPNVYSYGVMIDGYCKADRIEEGENLFELVTKKLMELNFVVFFYKFVSK